MRVKIGDRVYNSDDEPIMVILNGTEKWFVDTLDPDDNRFIVYPSDSLSEEEVEEFMKIK